MLLSSMIVDNLDIVGMSLKPYETDAPLLVDADAHLAGSISLQRFEPVAGWRPKVVQRARRIDLPQLS
jgi:hypothetical protein